MKKQLVSAASCMDGFVKNSKRMELYLARRDRRGRLLLQHLSYHYLSQHLGILLAVFARIT